MLRPAFDRDRFAEFVRVVLPETDRVIGEVSLTVHSLLHRGGELGYALHPDQGDGRRAPRATSRPPG